MTEYDLKSLNLPKLYGSMLKVFDAITSSKLTRPLIIGPPEQTMDGMLMRHAPITIPGTILSQFGTRTSPSN